VTVSDTDLTASVAGESQKATWTPQAESEGLLTIETIDADGTKEIAEVRFEGDDAIVIVTKGDEQQPMRLDRKK
jgi:hypothetical protein